MNNDYRIMVGFSELKYIGQGGDAASLEALREEYPDLQSCLIAAAELEGLLALPKGTTYYFSDIHGQGDKFRHIMHNKAGIIRQKIDEVMPDLNERDKIELSKICFYPRAALRVLAEDHADKASYHKAIENYTLWLARLIQHTGSKTTRRTFREKINLSPFHDSIQEFVSSSNDDKIGSDYQMYQRTIIRRYISAGLVDELIEEMTRVFKQLLVYRYVINGDIPDRGADTAMIIDMLMHYQEKYGNVVVNWGNHDLLWMGAAAGSRELICDLVRIQLRYGHQKILHEDYGISLDSLRDFAAATYTERPGKGFKVQPVSNADTAAFTEIDLMKMQKALAVMMWKLEAGRSADLGVEPYLRNVRVNGEGRLIVHIQGRAHVLLDQDLPTLDMTDPTRLSKEEKQILDDLHAGFKKSTRMQEHMRFLARIGGLYHLEDDVLSYHAIVPLNEDGSLREMEILGQRYKGKELFDTLTSLYKGAFTTANPPQKILDLFYQGWKGADSWTFGKSSMETFTRSLVEDKTTHQERKSTYYSAIGDTARAEAAVEAILADFVDDVEIARRTRIYNGHVPVKVTEGESAIKGNGRIICGDGGFSEAYGDLGFCLISTSKALYLNKLGPSVSEDDVVGRANKDIVPELMWKEPFEHRKCLRDSTAGRHIMARIEAIDRLADMYRRNRIDW